MYKWDLIDIDVILSFLWYVPEKRQYNVNINQIPLVQLRNVTYRYKDATQNALNNINLDINEGDNIALVGSSGAGKSL